MKITYTTRRDATQAEGHHYSTFSLYTPDELRASIATFLARLPSPEVSWVDEHLLVVVGGSRRNQAEPVSSSSPASQQCLPGAHSLPPSTARVEPVM